MTKSEFEERAVARIVAEYNSKITDPQQAVRAEEVSTFINIEAPEYYEGNCSIMGNLSAHPRSDLGPNDNVTYDVRWYAQEDELWFIEKITTTVVAMRSFK